MKILIPFVFSFICIYCSSNPVENNSIYSYEDVKLDTTGTILNENDIMATWALKSFVELSDCSVENEPEGYPTPVVVISFQDSEKVIGHTGADFTGNYTLSNNKIKITPLLRPELPEPKPEWANMFYDATEMTDYAFIEKLKLFIFYNQSSQVMVFTKN